MEAKTPATGKTKQLPQITPLKGFNYQPSSDRPALALIDTNSINSFETPRGKRLAARNSAKQVPERAVESKPSQPEKTSSHVDPVSDEVLNGLDTAITRKGRSKREFKRAVEKALVVEEPVSISQDVSLVGPVAEPEAPEMSLIPTTEQIDVVESEQVVVSAAMESQDSVVEVVDAKSGASADVEELEESKEASVNLDDLPIPNANMEVAEAMASRRQARKGRTTKAKKTDSVVPVLALEAPEPRTSLSDMDFGALDEAIMEAFSPRGKGESSEPVRRKGRPARGKTAANEEPALPAAPKRSLRSTKAKVSRATKATKKVEVEEDASPTVPEDEFDSVAQDDQMEVSEIGDKTTTTNIKKRSRTASLEPEVNEEPAAAFAPQPAPSQTPLDVLDQDTPSPKRRCTTECESPSLAVATPSSSETEGSPSSETSHPVKDSADMVLDVVSMNGTESALQVFERVESEVYGTETDDKVSEDDSPRVDAMGEAVQMQVDLDIDVPSNDSFAKSSTAIEIQADMTSKKHLIEKRSSEMISSTAVSSAPPQLSRASTNTANPVTSKTAFAAINAASASRLNEKIARIQENKAELEAKRRTDLEAKQKLEKEKTTERIRERLDLVRKRTATTTSSRNLTANLPIQPSQTSGNPTTPAISAADVQTVVSVQTSSDEILPSSAPLEIVQAPQTVAELVKSPARPKPVLTKSLAGEGEQTALVADAASHSSSTSAGTPSTPKKPSEEAAMSAIEATEAAKETKTPPTSPSRLMLPPSLADSAAMSLKKSTPRRFLPGLMSKDKTPAKRTPGTGRSKNGLLAPSSSVKQLNSPSFFGPRGDAQDNDILLATPRTLVSNKMENNISPEDLPAPAVPAQTSASKKGGFWGNLFGLLGAKKQTEEATSQSRLVSDSPLFSPTVSQKVADTTAPLPKPQFGSSPQKLVPNKSKARVDASWSPLIAPAATQAVSQQAPTADSQAVSQHVPVANPQPSSGKGQAMIISLDSSSEMDASLDDSLLLPSSALSQQVLKDYSAGIRTVPLLDSGSEDDDDDLQYYGESSSESSFDDLLGRLDDEEESFQILSGSGAGKSQALVTTMKIASPALKPSVSAPALPNHASSAQINPTQLTSASKAGVVPRTPEKDPLERNPFFDTPEMQVVPDTPKKRSLGLDDDDEDDPTGAVWTRSRHLLPILEMQASIDPDEIFGTDFPTTCDLGEIFSEVKVRIMARPRTSSGLWTRDKLTVDEKKEYKRRMGYTVQTLRKEERR